VDVVWPLYGPIAGGTRITIIGQFLSASTVKAVYIGQYKVIPNINRLSFSLIWTIFGMVLHLRLMIVYFEFFLDIKQCAMEKITFIYSCL